MKSKEEIYLDFIDEAKDDWGIYNEETIHKIMDSWAKQEAIGFADWIYKNGDLLYAQIMHEKKTTEQLYNLYLENKKKN